MTRPHYLAHIIIIVMMAMVTIVGFSACSGDDDIITEQPTPHPDEEPNEEEEQEQEEEEEEEEDSIINNTISKLIFTQEANPDLDRRAVYYPDSTGLFSGRLYTRKYINGTTSVLPLDMHNMVPLFETDAKEIYVNNVAITNGETPCDLSKPIVVTAVANNGQRRDYTIDMKHYSGLPIMFIDLASGGEVASKEEYEDATIEIWGEGQFEDLERMPMRIHGRGNSSWNTFLKKRSYTISLDSKKSLCGMPKHKKWVLISNYRDKTLLRNNVAWWISSHLSGMKYTTRFQHVELILNGTHRGVYQLAEQVRIDNDRVNINEMKPTDTEGESITGGYLIELDRGYDSDQWVWTLPNLQGSSNRASIKKPKIDESNSQQRAYIRNYLMTVDSLLGTSTDMEYVMEKYIDMPSWAAQWLVFELSGTPEPSGPNSWYTYKDKSDDKWYCGPPWDFDYKSFLPSTASQWRSKDYVYQPQMRRYEPYRDVLIAQWEEIAPLLPELIAYINEQREYMRMSAKFNWDIHEQNLIDDNRKENGDEFIPSDEAIDRMIEYLEQKWVYVENNIRNLQ